MFPPTCESVPTGRRTLVGNKLSGARQKFQVPETSTCAWLVATATSTPASTSDRIPGVVSVAPV
jgi:hypothetical protein